MTNLTDLYHRCIHPGRTHLCACTLNRDHTDEQWDVWYDQEEARRDAR